jgi:hypothetical protein
MLQARGDHVQTGKRKRKDKRNQREQEAASSLV